MATRKKFIRRNHDKYKRLGGSKKKLIWRKSKGRHGKMREGRKGYPASPRIGRGSPTLAPIMIENMKQLLALKKGDEAMLRSIGKKKRMEIENKAKELNITILNKK